MVVPAYAQGAYEFFPESVMTYPGGSTAIQSTVGVTIAVK